MGSVSYWSDPQRARRAARLAVLGVIKSSRGCALCMRESDPRMLEFAHMRGMKCFSVNACSVGRPLESLVCEISKCAVLCIRCHRTADKHRLAGLRDSCLPSDEVRATMAVSGAWPDAKKRPTRKE